MTRTVTCLEEADCLRRLSGRDDGRTTIVELTDRGRALLSADRQANNAWLERQLRGLSEEQRNLLRGATEILEGLSHRD
jgi:DNA-binding MarR family transcriptional regulator